MADEHDDPSSFAQEYDAKEKTAQTLHLYCRLCRRIFPVHFKPRPEARLRCLCGHETALSEIDVFKTETRAKDFATLYERIYRAAKDALRAANLPIPPSGKLPQIRDGIEIPSEDMPFRAGDLEDASDVASSYVGDGSDIRGAEAREREDELRAEVDAAEDVLAKHEKLSELIEHLYCSRHLDETSFPRFERACRDDMKLAKEVIEEAKARKRAGETVKVSFTSFKHLGLVLEEREDFEGAALAADAATKVGLPGYKDRAQEMRARAAKQAKKKASARAKKSSADAKKSSTSARKSSADAKKSSTSARKSSADARKSKSGRRAPPKAERSDPDESSEPIVLTTSSDEELEDENE